MRLGKKHFLSQCWPRSLSPYGATWPQYVKGRFVVVVTSCVSRGGRLFPLLFLPHLPGLPWPAAHSLSRPRLIAQHRAAMENSLLVLCIISEPCHKWMLSLKAVTGSIYGPKALLSEASKALSAPRYISLLWPHNQRKTFARNRPFRWMPVPKHPFGLHTQNWENSLAEKKLVHFPFWNVRKQNTNHKLDAIIHDDTSDCDLHP